MNFYNEDEDKKGAPVIPGSASPFKKTSAFGRQPMFSRAAGSIADRLKNLSRKDLAFVAIGLSVLVMAPVAEYMMSQPAQDNLLKETFNPRSGPGLTDPGINGLSTGSPDGSGEVITPLSSRDPMSLIVGAQQPAPVMPPSAPPSTSFRDSMKESGRAAFTEAAKSAGAPTVIPRMQSALRGLSFSGGGEGTRTSGSLGGGKIIDDARSASSKAAKRSMVGPVAMAGYKGVASTPNSSSKGAFEKLRAQADKSAGNFSGGSAMNSLDKAAADAVDIRGAGGMGAGGDSEKIKGGSGSTTKYDHNRSGETLAEAAAKARQQKALEWEFFKKYEFKKQLLTAVFGAISTEVGKFVGGAVGGVLNPSPPSPPALYCWGYKPGTTECEPKFPMSLCSKDKGVTCDPKDCPCGIKPKDAGGTGTTPGNTTPTGPGTSQGNSGPAITWPIPVATDFDGELKTLRLNIQKAEDENDDAKEFTKLAVNVAGGLYQISGQGNKGNEFPFVVGNSIAKIGEFNQAQQSYKMKANQARIALDELVKQNESIMKALEAAQTKQGDIAKSKGQKLTENSGATAELVIAGTTNVVGTQLTAYVDGVKVMQESAKILETELAYLERGAVFYTKQAETVNTAATGMRAKSITISGKARAAMEKMEGYKRAVEAGQVTPELLKEISASFMEVTGIPLEISDSSSSVPAARDGEVSLVDQLLVLRGAEKDAYWKKTEVNDDKFKQQEPRDWAQISPKAKMGNLADPLESPALAAEMQVVPVLNIRAENELPADLRALNDKLVGLFGDGKGKIEQLKGISDAHKKKVEDFIGTPVNPNPNPNPNPDPNPNPNPNPTPVVDPALTGRQTALLAHARNATSDYEAAKAVKISGTGPNAQYARSDLRKMTDSHANIVRLTNELTAEGAKPTKEKLDELELYLGNFNKAYGDFQTHAKAAGATVPQPVKPQPTVIINNNVSANSGANVNANLNANANSVSGATVNNKPPVVNTTVNNTNNNVVNNTTQPKPPVQPQQPQAKPAATSFTLPMSGGTALTLTTAAGNTGLTAVYTGGHRSGFMDWLYKYEVVCKRQKNTEAFTVYSVQRTKALFTTGVSVGGPEAVTGFSGRSCQ